MAQNGGGIPLSVVCPLLFCPNPFFVVCRPRVMTFVGFVTIFFILLSTQKRLDIAIALYELVSATGGKLWVQARAQWFYRVVENELLRGMPVMAKRRVYLALAFFRFLFVLLF